MTEAQALVVDDEAINLEIIQEYFADEPWLTVHTAPDGETAWTMLNDERQRFDVILLDRMMPGLDGIGLLQRIKAAPQLAGIPVIMQTAASSPAQIREGLEAGAYYYLTKPYQRDSLIAIVQAALADARARDGLRHQLHQHRASLRFLERASFSISRISEAAELASLVAHACPNPDNVVMGLSELLVNGIEHGNLGVSYEEKSRFKREERWLEEIEARERLPENRNKRVTLDFERSDAQITLRVTDQGAGFDWQKFLEIDPVRAFDPNGRGIALARMLSFSSIHYEGRGNVAVAGIVLDTKDATQ